MTANEPANIIERIDCGSGHHYGICPKCRRGHGYKIELRRSATTTKAIRSLMACVRLNLIQALSATLAGRPRLALHHRLVASHCRRDANALR